MKKILTILLCGVLVLCLAACGGKDADTSTTTPTDPTEENYEKVYVDNPVVNGFINDLYEKGDLQLLGTSRGAKEGEYILHTNNCEVTVSPTKYGLFLDIRGGKTQQDLKNAISLFRYFTLVADSSADKNRIDEAADKMMVVDGSFTEYRVSNYVQILRFTALTNQPTVSVDCHIEMLLMNYLFNDEE